MSFSIRLYGKWLRVQQLCEYECVYITPPYSRTHCTWLTAEILYLVVSRSRDTADYHISQWCSISRDRCDNVLTRTRTHTPAVVVIISYLPLISAATWFMLMQVSPKYTRRKKFCFFFMIKPIVWPSVFDK